MGAYLIAFTPCAYVDASAAWGLPQLRQRVVVSLAGMYLESIVAFFALLVWSWTDDLLISSCAHQIVVLSTAVTVLFNINPLMRYDGYYVLSDVTGTPNLRQRSLEEVQSMFKRIDGDPFLREQRTDRSDWFLRIYGMLSAIYKVSLVLAICTMIALKFYLVGMGLARNLPGDGRFGAHSTVAGVPLVVGGNAARTREGCDVERAAGRTAAGRRRHGPGTGDRRGGRRCGNRRRASDLCPVRRLSDRARRWPQAGAWPHSKCSAGWRMS